MHVTDTGQLIIHRATPRIKIKCTPEQGKDLDRAFAQGSIQVTSSDNLSSGYHSINLPWPLEPVQIEVIYVILNRIRKLFHDIVIDAP